MLGLRNDREGLNMSILKRIEPKKWDVRIEELNIPPLKINEEGIKLSVYDGDDYLGDLVLKNTKVIWRTRKDKKMPEKEFTWINFIKLMEGHRKKEGNR